MKYLYFLLYLGILTQCKDFFNRNETTNPYDLLEDFQAKPHQVQWPISDKDGKLSERITSVFGESRWDHFHNGIDIASYQEPVYSIADGYLLYTRYASDDPFREEWGSGDTVWILHGKGYYSSYFHLSPTRVPLSQEIQKGQMIGKTGNTGHSSGAHLHFILMKDYGKTIINPLQILPPIQDPTPPMITNLYVHVGDRYTNINSGDTIQLSKAFPFTVGIVDSGVRSSQRWGVQAVQFKLNGKIIKESRFHEIRFNGISWLNDDGLTFQELFLKDRYFIGELSLPSGEHTIEVIAADFHGNTAYRSYTFYVNRL